MMCTGKKARSETQFWPHITRICPESFAIGEICCASSLDTLLLSQEALVMQQCTGVLRCTSAVYDRTRRLARGTRDQASATLRTWTSISSRPSDDTQSESIQLWETFANRALGSCYQQLNPGNNHTQDRELIQKWHTYNQFESSIWPFDCEHCEAAEHLKHNNNNGFMVRHSATPRPVQIHLKSGRDTWKHCKTAYLTIWNKYFEDLRNIVVPATQNDALVPLILGTFSTSSFSK